MARPSQRDISKFLSYLLRHRPETLELELDERGWTDAAALIEKVNAHRGWSLDLAALEAVVAADSKGRYGLEDGRIRAHQGHSVNDVLAADPTPRTPPARLYHGTTVQRWTKIKKSGGLKKMSRHHVHLSEALDTAWQVGRRHKKETAMMLVVDAAAMAAEGAVFLLSDNGVWLTDAVAERFLSVLEP